MYGANGAFHKAKSEAKLLKRAQFLHGGMSSPATGLYVYDVWNLTVPLYFAHPYLNHPGDCTHYCLAVPYLWNVVMLKHMTRFADTPVRCMKWFASNTSDSYSLNLRSC